MIGRLLKWGNSYGVRLSKADVERLGVRPGADVAVEVRPLDGQVIDLSNLTFFRDIPDLSVRHDEFAWKK